ncbi:hypothetical protein C2G38_2197329 [Gigaspora rosea]|uniref:Uncharacterized protein n=1 Tax=Gigaspora rosea TaxID=44941 RepID=A0A397UTS7_9GLOM|nr:hypothetical protein C2G38_2197329 [Gigaspora rosea]
MASSVEPLGEPLKLDTKSQQFQTQQNYQKDLNKQQTIEVADFDYNEEMELDITNEELYEKFICKNKNNSLFSGFN